MVCSEYHISEKSYFYRVHRAYIIYFYISVLPSSPVVREPNYYIND